MLQDVAWNESLLDEIVVYNSKFQVEVKWE